MYQSTDIRYLRPEQVQRYLIVFQWHHHHAPSSSCSLKLSPRSPQRAQLHSFPFFISPFVHKTPLHCKTFPSTLSLLFFFSTSRSEPCELEQEATGINRVLDLEVRRGCVLLPTTLKLRFRPPANQTFTKDTIPEILQPSSDCSRLETCSQTWSWHLARGILSLGQGPGSCHLIRPWGSWHTAMFMLSRSLVPASWYRFNHACPPFTMCSILGPWLVHATPVHLRFLPAVSIYKYASSSRPSAKRKRQASTNMHSLCRNLDHIDTPDAQVASLPNSRGPCYTFSHLARKTTTPTLYGTQ